MRRLLRYIFIPICVLAAHGASGAAPEVTARITPDSISIGDHATLDVTVTKDIMHVVEFPVFKDNKLGDAIEILQEFDVDTVSTDGRRVTLSKQFILTGFDAGHYTIDGFPILYVDKNIVDTLFSPQKLHFTITTPEIDTTRNTIYDIKQPEAAPLLVSEVRGYFIATIVWLCVAAAIICLVINAIRRRRRKAGIFGDGQPHQLPHIRAINELEALHHQKLWQNNHHKLYHSSLTDILRVYIDGRYGIRAMEMTTDEIMTATKHTLTGKSYVDLKEILRTADLVKFAKLIPDGDRNETLYYKAYYFVEETKPMAEAEPEKPDLKIVKNE